MLAIALLVSMCVVEIQAGLLSQSLSESKSSESISLESISLESASLESSESSSTLRVSPKRNAKAFDIVMVEQIKNNLFANFAIQARGGGDCTDEFSSFILENTSDDVKLILTGDFVTSQTGPVDFYTYFCDFIGVDLIDEDYFDSTFSVSSFDKNKNYALIRATSNTLIYSIIPNEDDGRATYILRNQWEFKRTYVEYDGIKTEKWVLSAWKSEVERVNITNFI